MDVLLLLTSPCPLLSKWQSYSIFMKQSLSPAWLSQENGHSPLWSLAQTMSLLGSTGSWMLLSTLPPALSRVQVSGWFWCGRWQGIEPEAMGTREAADHQEVQCWLMPSGYGVALWTLPLPGAGSDPVSWRAAPCRWVVQLQGLKFAIAPADQRQARGMLELSEQ